MCWKIAQHLLYFHTCDVGVKVGEFSNSFVASPTSQLILQHFRLFTYVTAHSRTLPLLHLRHSLFSNPSVASPTSQLILQPFFRFSYVTGSSLTSPGEQQSIRQCSYQLPCLHVSFAWLLFCSFFQVL